MPNSAAATALRWTNSRRSSMVHLTTSLGAIPQCRWMIPFRDSKGYKPAWTSREALAAEGGAAEGAHGADHEAAERPHRRADGFAKAVVAVIEGGKHRPSP